MAVSVSILQNEEVQEICSKWCGDHIVRELDT